MPAGGSRAREPGPRIAYGEITSVLVESNCKLELSYRRPGLRGYVFFLPPLRYAVFLQHFLRLRAFANPYARYRGSGRVELPPARSGLKAQRTTW